jgi:DNA helicase HerA-like ATPase
MGVTDLIDPDRGLVSVIETEGLDYANRRVILGSVLLAVYRYGLLHGEGVFDHNHKGPGALVVLEEAHELFGTKRNGEDEYSASTRTELYESMFRRARALGMRLIPVVQQPSCLPDAVTANVNSVFIHKVQEELDRRKVGAMLNWSNQIGQQAREFRYLGELPVGYCIVRLSARTHYLESAPVQILVDPPPLSPVSDNELAARARIFA